VADYRCRVTGELRYLSLFYFRKSGGELGARSVEEPLLLFQKGLKGPAGCLLSFEKAAMELGCILLHP